MKKKIVFFRLTVITVIAFFNLSVITDQNTDTSLHQLMQIANANAEESTGTAFYNYKIHRSPYTETFTMVQNGITYTKKCIYTSSDTCVGTGGTLCTPKPAVANCDFI